MNPLDPPPVVLPRFEFGTVLQHTLVANIRYLVLTPFNTPSGVTQDYRAMRIDESDHGVSSQGDVVIIGHSDPTDWNVLEIIRADA
jgi:hypothetical protein